MQKQNKKITVSKAHDLNIQKKEGCCWILCFYNLVILIFQIIKKKKNKYIHIKLNKINVKF
jgi:hypothetical protein